MHELIGPSDEAAIALNVFFNSCLNAGFNKFQSLYLTGKILHAHILAESMNEVASDED